MARYIITGNYTQAAMQGMVAHPSDRGAATAAMITAAGGKQEAFYLTTGDNDFLMVVETSDVTKMLACLIAAGASGSSGGFKTVQAFTSAEFTEAQKLASAMAKAYKAPN